MPIANLVALLIVLACVGYLYAKGKLVTAFAATIIAVCAGIVAFAYFELLAGLILSRGDRFASIVPWAQTIAFILLFIVSFAVLQAIVGQIIRQPVVIGDLPDRIGRAFCGIFLGLEIAGILLVALAMAPLPNKYPYPRFGASPQPDKPKELFLSPDGFASGWFSTVSAGSLSGRTSFAALHPDFLDQAFLNRFSARDGVSIVTASSAIELPRRRQDPNNAAAWRASEDINTTDGKAVPPKSGHNLVIVRVGFKKSNIREGGRFTPSQLRLICKQRGLDNSPVRGRGINVYPIGYMQEEGTLKLTRLTEKIIISFRDFVGGASVRWVDFAFYVPADHVPTFIEFKQNSIAEVPPLVSAEDAPPTVPFNPDAEKKAAPEKTPSKRPARNKRR